MRPKIQTFETTVPRQIVVKGIYCSLRCQCNDYSYCNKYLLELEQKDDKHYFLRCDECLAEFKDEEGTKNDR